MAGWLAGWLGQSRQVQVLLSILHRPSGGKHLVPRLQQLQLASACFATLEKPSRTDNARVFGCDSTRSLLRCAFPNIIASEVLTEGSVATEWT